MKIAIIAHSNFPVAQPFSGGLAAHTYHMTVMLQQLGYDVTLFAPKGSDKNLPVEVFCNPSVTSTSKPTNDLVYQKEQDYRDLMETLRISDFDIIHNNSLHRAPLDYVSSLPMPMATVLHTPPAAPMVDGFRKAVTAPNHYTMAVSKRIASVWSKELKFIKPKVAYNGVDTVKWLPTHAKNISEYAVWSGRITAEKGTHLAVEAAVKVNIPLKICGPMHDQQYFDTTVAPLLAKHKNIQYLGNLQGHNLVQVINRATVFVCTPCWEEAFGLVVAEALACGVPVAGFKRGALPEILTAETGVLVDEDTTALAGAINKAKLLDRQVCRKHAVDNFSIEKMISDYTTLYNQAVQQPMIAINNV